MSNNRAERGIKPFVMCRKNWLFANTPADAQSIAVIYSYQHEDADFMVGEHVMLMVQCYDHEKLQMYSKIMSKW